MRILMGMDYVSRRGAESVCEMVWGLTNLVTCVAARGVSAGRLSLPRAPYDTSTLRMQTVGADAANDYIRTGTVSAGTVNAANRARTAVAASLAPLQTVGALAAALLPQVPASRQHFYTGHTILQVRV